MKTLVNINPSTRTETTAFFGAASVIKLTRLAFLLISPNNTTSRFDRPPPQHILHHNSITIHSGVESPRSWGVNKSPEKVLVSLGLVLSISRFVFTSETTEGCFVREREKKVAWQEALKELTDVYLYSFFPETMSENSPVRERLPICVPRCFTEWNISPRKWNYQVTKKAETKGNERGW